MRMPEVEPLTSSLKTVVEFRPGGTLPGTLDLHFLPSCPLEVGCVIKVPRPGKMTMEGEFMLERDSMVRASMLPGLKAYGRIQRIPGDFVRIGLELDAQSELTVVRAVATVHREELERFLRKTMEHVEVASSVENGLIESALDAWIEDVLTNG